MHYTYMWRVETSLAVNDPLTHHHSSQGWASLYIFLVDYLACNYMYFCVLHVCKVCPILVWWVRSKSCLSQVWVLYVLSVAGLGVIYLVCLVWGLYILSVWSGGYMSCLSGLGVIHVCLVCLGCLSFIPTS